MPKILLIQPTQYSSKGGKLIKQSRIYLPALVFPLLAALTPKNWELEVNIEVIDDIDFDNDADIIGIGAMGHSTFRGLDIAKEFRKRGKTVFFGGYMSSIFPEYVEQYADGVIIGDAEIAYPKLLKDFEKTGKIKKIYNFPLKNLNGLPIPKYEVLTAKKIGFMLPVQAARGCPHTCGFCSISCLYEGKHISRPVEEVINDILRVKEMGYNMFYLIDDNLVGNPKYIRELCLQIKPLKMKWASQCTLNIAKKPELLKLIYESGCRILSLGVETINQEGLNELGKNWVKANEHITLLNRIRKVGILPSTEMIIGTDQDTVESIREIYKFIMEAKITIPRFYILTPIPGTDYFKQMKEEGRLIHEDYEKYKVSNCVHYPKKISPKELNEMYTWLNTKVFSLKSILLRVFINKNFLRNPLLHLYAFVVNLKYRQSTRKGDVPNIL